MVAPLAASAAYQAMAKLGSAGVDSASSAGASATGATPGAGFGDFLSGALKDAMSNMRAGEQAATQQVSGKADIVNVVNAVNQAELTLDTVVAVRDKVIQAYQSVMQMAI
jgi:flagellar hook-basal body complex protein FliE